jgi:hypothetical protein
MVSAHRRFVCHRFSHAEDLAGGVVAEIEACRIVSEKIETGLALQALALTGGLGLTASRVATKMLTHYRRKVRANRRRLAER